MLLLRRGGVALARERLCQQGVGLRGTASVVQRPVILQCQITKYPGRPEIALQESRLRSLVAKPRTQLARLLRHRQPERPIEPTPHFFEASLPPPEIEQPQRHLSRRDTAIGIVGEIK